MVDENATTFDDGAAYKQFMGRWSRAVGAVFLEWLAASKGASWLDVGCGTGAFTELVVETCSPASVVAVDPSVTQINYAREQQVAQLVDFQVADAQSLPFPNRVFDVVASALVINFIPDRQRALTEMRRVSRPFGVVAGYVWDFAKERNPTWPLALGIRQIGIEPPRIAGTEESSIKALEALFEGAGFDDIAVKSIEVTMEFSNFDDYWRTQTPAFLSLSKIIAKMSKNERIKMIEFVRSTLPTGPNGSIAYSVRANAIKARMSHDALLS